MRGLAGETVKRLFLIFLVALVGVVYLMTVLLFPRIPERGETPSGAGSR